MRLAAWLAAGLIVPGCAHFEESAVVKVFSNQHGEQLEPPEFYRLTVDLDTWFERTDFAAGWYDADAVDALFGELPVFASSDGKTPMGGAVVGTRGSGTGLKPEKRFLLEGPLGTARSVDGKRLVIVASNSPSAIINQIKTVSESAAAMGLLARATTGSARSQRDSALAADAADRKRHEALVAAAGAAAADLAPPADGAQPISSDQLRRTLTDLVRLTPPARR